MPRIFNQLMIISFLSTSSLVISMDQKPTIHQSIVTKEITAISQPRQVSSLKGGNTLLVSNVEGSFIVDWQTNQKTSDLLIGKYQIGTFPNKQKNAVVAVPCCDGITGKIQLFDIESKQLKWECETELNPYFDPSYTFAQNGDLYVVKGDGNMRCSNGQFYYSRDAQTGYKGIITTHPSEEKIFFTKVENIAGKLKASLGTIKFNKPLFPDVSFDELPENLDADNDRPYAQAHSSIGEIIALCYASTPLWVLYNQITKQIVRNLPNCRLLAFHPNKPLSAMLTKDGFVEISDINTGDIIAKTEKPFEAPSPAEAVNQRLIDFSEDGENLAVIVNDKCFVLSNLYPKNN